MAYSKAFIASNERERKKKMERREAHMKAAEQLQNEIDAIDTMLVKAKSEAAA